MNENTITRIQSRADTKANWEAENPLLLVNEIGYENDTKRLKMGDGNKRWNELPYYINISNGEGENSLIQDLESLAISKNSVALGSNNTAGCKGYYYRAIDFTNKIIYLSEGQVKRPSNTPGEEDIITNFVTPQYNKGETFSMNNVEGYYSFCGVIEEIKGNRIYYKDPLPFNATGTKDASRTKDYIFFVPNQPEIGLVTFTEGGSSVGGNSKASGEFSFAAGEGNIAGGNYSTALGRNTKAGYTGFTAGQKTVTTGPNAVAMGDSARADGQTSFAFGNQAKASKDYSIAMGSNSQTEAKDSIAIGKVVKATGNEQTVLGKYNQEDSSKSFIIGNGSSSGKKNALTIDANSNIEVLGNIKMNEGKDLVGKDSDIAIKTTQNGAAIGAVGGTQSSSTGDASFAFGHQAEATQKRAVAFGQQSKAYGEFSFAEGYGAQASGQGSHAEGHASRAVGISSHAEGEQTKAKGNYSHSEGDHTETYEDAIAAHAEGIGNHATTAGQHVQGKYSITDTQQNFAHIVGNGTNTKRSNAHTIDWDGNAWFAGEVTIGENRDKLVGHNEFDETDQKVESIIYYNEASIIPSDIELFEFELDENNLTAKIKFNTNNDRHQEDQGEYLYDKEIIIPYEYVTNGKKYKVTEIAKSGFMGCKHVPKFVLPNSIQIIGDAAFQDCFEINNITIPNSVIEIKSLAFAYCNNLYEIILSKNLQTINDSAFHGCEKLAYVYFSGSKVQWDTILIGSDGNEPLLNGQIYYTNSEINQTDFNEKLNQTNKIVDEIRYYDELNLIPTEDKYFSLDTINNQLIVTDLPDNKELIIPYIFNEKIVYSVNIEFQGQTIEKLTIPNTIQSLSFSDITIKKLYLPLSIKTLIIDKETEGISVINEIYYKGTEEDWDKINKNKEILDKKYFQWCGINKEAIKNIDNKIFDINKNFDNIQYYEKANIIPSEQRLFDIKPIDQNKMTAEISMSAEFFDTQSEEILYYGEIIIPYEYTTASNNTYKITSIAPQGFFKGTGITNIILPNTIETIGEHAFDDCLSIARMVIPESVNKIEKNAFTNCSGLNTLILPKSLKELQSYAIYYNIFDLNIYYNGTEKDWQKINIDENAIASHVPIYYQYNAISENAISTKLKSFEYYYNINSITPSSNDNFIIYTNNQTLTATIKAANNALNGTIIIPYEYQYEDMTYKINSISATGFANTKINSITIPNSISNILQSTFVNCSELSEITFTNSIKTIMSGAFYNCNNLTKVYFKGSLEDWNNIEIQSGNENLLKATIYFEQSAAPDTEFNIFSDNSISNRVVLNEFDKRQNEIQNIINNLYYYNEKDVQVNTNLNFNISEDSYGNPLSFDLEIIFNTNSDTLIFPIEQINRTAFGSWNIMAFNTNLAKNIKTIVIPKNCCSKDMIEEIKLGLKQAFPNLKKIINIEKYGETIIHTFDN